MAHDSCSRLTTNSHLHLHIRPPLPLQLRLCLPLRSYRDLPQITCPVGGLCNTQLPHVGNMICTYLHLVVGLLENDAPPIALSFIKVY